MKLATLVLLCFGLSLNLSWAEHDTACRNTAGVNLAYAGHRFEAGDMSAALERVPPEQLLPGLDWLLFFNQNNASQSFMHPPQWQPSLIPADPLAGDYGVRLDAPDGSAAFETFLDGESFMAPRGSQVALDSVASFALSKVLGSTPYEVLCSDRAIAAEMASLGAEALFVAVATETQYAVVKTFSFRGTTEPSLFYAVYAGPKQDFEALVRFVFAPVMDSFPKGGGGSCSCEAGEPDRDNDGTCDRCDDYPDDPNRQ